MIAAAIIKGFYIKYKKIQTMAIPVFGFLGHIMIRGTGTVCSTLITTRLTTWLFPLGPTLVDKTVIGAASFELLKHPIALPVHVYSSTLGLVKNLCKPSDAIIVTSNSNLKGQILVLLFVPYISYVIFKKLHVNSELSRLTALTTANVSQGLAPYNEAIGEILRNQNDLIAKQTSVIAKQKILLAASPEKQHFLTKTAILIQKSGSEPNQAQFLLDGLKSIVGFTSQGVLCLSAVQLGLVVTVGAVAGGFCFYYFVIKPSKKDQ